MERELNGTRIDSVLEELMRAAEWESAGPQGPASPSVSPDTGIGSTVITNSQFPERVGRGRRPSWEIATRIVNGEPVIDQVTLASVMDMDGAPGATEG